ncbi:MAG: SRPBCC family protein [Ilumatobacteraceae bacterium]
MADGETDDTTAGAGPDERIVRGVKFVPADPQAIFDLLADPRQHAVFDGSGSVRSADPDNPERLSLGSKFGMSMKLGVPYKITNEVVEFDEPNVIAWRHMGHHVWRYRLRAVDGGTEVTEEFDWGVARSPFMLKVTGAPKKNARAIEATLDRLAAHFDAASSD